MPKTIESVHETILTEAKEILINSDYDSFNIRDLSQKCNISVGTIYNYFSNKYELVNSIFMNDWNKSLEKIKDINTEESSFYEKLYRVYQEIDDFLSVYLIIFLQITSKPKSHKHIPKHALESLYPLISEVLDIEREKGTLKSNLSNEKLNKFIVNNLMLLCNDKTLTFDEIFSLMNL